MMTTYPSDWQGFKWIRRDLRLAIYARDDFKCVYCGSTSDLSLDHLRPRSRNGDNHPRNLVTACLECNKTRGDSPWWDFVDDNEVIGRIKRNRRRSVKNRRKEAKRVLARISWKDVMRLIRKGALIWPS